MKPIWIWRSHSTIPQHIGTQTVTPIVRSIGVRWPGGGWLWQFPLAVHVKNEEDGAQRRLPIPDPTRTTIWFLVAFTLLLILIMAISGRGSKVQQPLETTSKRTKG